MTDEVDINRLLNRITLKLSITEFKAELSNFWERELSTRELLHDIRFKSGCCKKLMDEVMPVARYLKHERIDSGAIRFPLDNKIPDCFLWRGASEEPQQVEVTIAQGKARYHLMRELVEKGSGRGFTDLQDNASIHEFQRMINRERACYTTDQALSSTKRAIILSLEKKNDPKYAAMNLVIQARINVATLPRERWDTIKDDLLEAARGTPFQRVYVIGDDTEQLIGFRIK